MKLFINIIIALILLFKGVYTYSFADGLIPERILGDPTAKITIVLRYLEYDIVPSGYEFEPEPPFPTELKRYDSPEGAHYESILSPLFKEYDESLYDFHLNRLINLHRQLFSN